MGAPSSCVSTCPPHWRLPGLRLYRFDVPFVLAERKVKLDQTLLFHHTNEGNEKDNVTLCPLVAYIGQFTQAGRIVNGKQIHRDGTDCVKIEISDNDLGQAEAAVLFLAFLFQVGKG